MSDTKFKPRKDIEVQWGDPPKPNIWKVVQEVKYIRWGDDCLRVSSPLIRGYVKIAYDPRERVSAHSYYLEDYLAEPIPLEPEGYPLMPLSKITSHEFYKAFVAPKIADGTIKLSRGGSKLASSKLRAQWGNPPKPNLWSVEEHLGPYGDYVEVTSPLLGEDRAILLTSPAYNASRFYQIEIDLGDVVKVITGYKSVCTYQKALEFFLSPKGWRRISEWTSKQSKPVFKKDKVAPSTKLRAQWGNPPKPNLWKVEEYEEFVEVSSPLLGDSTISLTSPAYNGTYHYQVEFNNSHTSKIIMVVYSYPYENALKWFLGSTFWNWDFLKWVGEQSFPVFTTNKVASSV